LRDTIDKCNDALYLLTRVGAAEVQEAERSVSLERLRSPLKQTNKHDTINHRRAIVLYCAAQSNSITRSCTVLYMNADCWGHAENQYTISEAGSFYQSAI